MAWPEASAYSEAIQNPNICFKDLVLAKGKSPVNKVGLPRVTSGNFASVYKIEGTGSKWAVRCFLREGTDRQNRYLLLSQHLASISLPFLVQFAYLPEGIRIKGIWYPIIRMEWVEGETLSQYIENIRKKPNNLLNLAEQWRNLVNSLQNNGIAHGDLQHGNVMIANHQIKLVDYDAMYVPALHGQPSGEKGHANYQHPDRKPSDFGVDIDNFPALVIYVSIRALAVDANLWSYFNKDNLIFTSSDFANYKTSRLFAQLQNSSDSAVRELAAVIKNCCAGKISDVPKFETIVARLPAYSTIINDKRSSSLSNTTSSLPSWISSPQSSSSVVLKSCGVCNAILESEQRFCKKCGAQVQPGLPKVTKTHQQSATTTIPPPFHLAKNQNSTKKGLRTRNKAISAAKTNKKPVSLWDNVFGICVALPMLLVLWNMPFVKPLRTSFEHKATITTHTNTPIALKQRKYADSQYNLGLGLFKLQKYSKAETFFRKAVQLNPAEAEYQTVLGADIDRQGKFREAEPFYREAVRLEPGNDYFQGNLGNNLGNQLKYTEAETVLRKAIKIQPKEADYQDSLSTVFFNQGKYADAEKFSRAAVRLKPQDALYQNNLKLVLEKEHKVLSRQPYIGIGYNPFTLKGNKGVVVTKVFPNSPAADADIRIYDVILELNGQPITGSDEFLRMLHSGHIGDTIKLMVSRKGQVLFIHIKLKQTPPGYGQKTQTGKSAAHKVQQNEKTSHSIHHSALLPHKGYRQRTTHKTIHSIHHSVLLPQKRLEYVTVRINPEDGLLATEGCPEVVEKTFVKGEEPHRYTKMYSPPGEQ